MKQFHLIALLFFVVALLNGVLAFAQDGVPQLLFGLSSILMLTASAIFYFKSRTPE